jgi:hypothetical protein
MTDLVSKIRTVGLKADAGALLAYAILPSPDPLVVSGSGTLTLAVSNTTSHPMTVSSIAIDLEPGVNAKDLIATSDDLGSGDPVGWTTAFDGGIVTLTPVSTPSGADGMPVGADGIALVITGLRVNDQPGTSLLCITEVASGVGAPMTARTTTIAVPKFPQTFALSDLTVSQTSVAPGSSVVLAWNGTGGATCTLSYDPDGNGAQTFAVGENGPYSAQNLTAPRVVVFTLAATVHVTGQDQPLVVQRFAQVTVTTAALSFSALPSSVGVNGVVRLAWQTAGTSSRALAPLGSNLAAIGSAYVLVDATTTFTLTATEAGTGRPVEQQQTVIVDPSIVATSTIDLTGKAGSPGNHGVNDYFGGERIPGEPSLADGGTGGPGETVADVTQAIGPLDMAGTSGNVVLVSYAGGAGGPGGNGGDALVTGQIGNGGKGGKGGDAGKVTIQFSASGTPAQVIIALGAAPGGIGGNAGHNRMPFGGGRVGQPGANGAAGARGTVRFEDASS